MKTIIQEDTTGCGVASVANIVGLSYVEVKAKASSMGISVDDDSLFSDTEYVRKLLKKYDIQVSSSEIPFKSWESLPDLALLAIKYYEENAHPFWHWVVFKREAGNSVILDSASYLDKNERTDFDAMKPRWFIEVVNLNTG